MAIEDAAGAAGAAIEGLSQKVQASAAHIDLLARNVNAMLVGRNRDTQQISGNEWDYYNAALNFWVAHREGLLKDKDFLRRLAREMGQQMDSFDIVKILQEAIERRQAGPLLSAVTRALFGTNKIISAGNA